MEKTNQKIAIYSRKSKFTGKGESIENQIELCKSYISTHFPQLVDSILVFEDEGYSGGHLDRPKFQEMMSLIKKKEISHIICYRLDRISRNIGDFAGLIEELNDLNCGFVSIKEQFDTSSPMGRAMMYIASVFSQLERETIAERIRDNMRELAKTGRWLGGVTPTGYVSQAVEKITVDGKLKKAFKLVPIDEEIFLVKLIFSKFIETNSLSATETYLVQNNYKTKNGRDFSRFTIKNILENPVYMIADKAGYEFFNKQNVEIYSDITDFDDKSGIMAYNKTIQKRGKAHETREMSDWIIAVSKHEGIISGSDFSKVFDMLAHNKDKNYRKPRSHVALLSGILYCTCGYYMRPKMSSNKNADGEFTYSYLCTMKEKNKMQKCKMKNPNGNSLDKLVCNEIKKLSTEPSMFLAELERVRSEIKTDSESVSAQLERLSKLKKDKQNDIEKLTATVTNIIGTPAEVHLLKKLNDDGLELKKIEQSIADLESITTQNVMTDSEFDLLRDLLSNFASTFDDMGIEQKRMALRTFVKKIIWDGENAHIYPPDVDASLGDTTETKQTHVGVDDHIDPNNETQNHNQNQTNGTSNPSPTNYEQTPVGDGALDVPNDQLWTLSEHRKCNTITTAVASCDRQLLRNVSDEVLLESIPSDKWVIFKQISPNFFIHILACNYRILYAPLYIVSVKLPSANFNCNFKPNSIMDKLKYLREKNNFEIGEVAKILNIDRDTYSSLENIKRDFYPKKLLEKVSELYDEPFENLVDDYNLFMYENPAVEFKNARKAQKLTQKQFAEKCGVTTIAVKHIEHGRQMISADVWERVFGGADTR